MQESKYVGQREAVLLGQRDIEAVISGRRLQFEIERAAEAFSQREAPGFIDATAEGSMDHKLHAAALVEEALGDNRLLGWNRSENCAAGNHVFHDLFSARVVEAALFF